MTPDENAIHAIVKQLENGWNTGDAGAIAACFAEDATFIQLFGGQLDGRAAIEGSHRAILETIYKGTRAEWTVRSLRFLRADVAIAFTRGQVFFGAAPDPRDVDSRPTMVLTKDQDRWQIVAGQNTKVSPMPAAASAAAVLAK